MLPYGRKQEVSQDQSQEGAGCAGRDRGRGRVGSPAMSAADRANQELVDRLIAQEALWSLRLIAAFRQTP